jgi:hypothetical protein
MEGNTKISKEKKNKQKNQSKVSETGDKVQSVVT